jgi:hypothetical protein
MLASPSAAYEFDMTGDWHTGIGPMTVTELADGSYRVDFELVPLRVRGRRDGDNLIGTWSGGDERDCGSEKHGSRSWGDYEIEFWAEHGMFRARFNFCGVQDNGASFKGARLDITYSP